MISSNASILLGFFSSLLIGASSQQCWYPDGVTQSTDTPCNASASASSCCNKDDMCLDNGLCLHFGIISRGSCTDQNWSSENCPQYCIDQPSGGVTLMPCNAWGSVFSCSWGNCSESNLFSVNGGSAVMLRADQVAPLGSPAAVTVAAPDVLRSANTTELKICPNNDTSPEDSGVANVHGGQYTSGEMVAVAAGIGVPLALALTGTIILLARQRRVQGNHSRSTDQGLASNRADSVVYPSQTLKGDSRNIFHELGHPQIGEMDAFPKTQELSALGSR